MHASSASGGLDVVLLALVLAALLVAFAWLLSRRAPPPVPEDAEALPPDEATPAPAPPGDPDALAANGRFEDAMRAVLLRALESVGWSAEESAATTAREVVRGLGGADARRQPLGEIVRHAETVHFGGTPATRERYEEMRALLDRLPLRGSAS